MEFEEEGAAVTTAKKYIQQMDNIILLATRTQEADGQYFNQEEVLKSDEE